jgi:hypothetical protein
MLRWGKISIEDATGLPGNQQGLIQLRNGVFASMGGLRGQRRIDKEESCGH